MKNAACVYLGQRGKKPFQYIYSLPRGEPAVFFHIFIERNAAEKFHCIVSRAVFTENIVDLGDIVHAVEAKGEEICKTARASMDENERELLKALNDDEKGQLRNLLQKVYDSIKSC